MEVKIFIYLHALKSLFYWVLYMDITLESIIRDSMIATILVVYILIVVWFVTRRLYNYMINRGIKHNVVVYYNRKLIHISTGGLASIIVAYFFKEPLVPLIMAAFLGIIVYIPHRKKKLLYWFQTEDNMFEVHFCFAWGISLFILWTLFNEVFQDPYASFKAVLPAIFISFGDAVTGIARNYVFGKRTKHWIGNIFMAITMIPLGYLLASIPGLVAAIIASIVERVEIGNIDDNIVIPAATVVILILFRALLNM